MMREEMRISRVPAFRGFGVCPTVALHGGSAAGYIAVKGEELAVIAAAPSIEAMVKAMTPEQLPVVLFVPVEDWPQMASQVSEHRRLTGKAGCLSAPVFNAVYAGGGCLTYAEYIHLMEIANAQEARQDSVQSGTMEQVDAATDAATETIGVDPASSGGDRLGSPDDNGGGPVQPAEAAVTAEPCNGTCACHAEADATGQGPVG